MSRIAHPIYSPGPALTSPAEAIHKFLSSSLWTHLVLQSSSTRLSVLSGRGLHHRTRYLRGGAQWRFAKKWMNVWGSSWCCLKPAAEGMQSAELGTLLSTWHSILVPGHSLDEMWNHSPDHSLVFIKILWEAFGQTPAGSRVIEIFSFGTVSFLPS